MPADDPLMSRIDDVLTQEPMWEPPRAFAARVALMAPIPAPKRGFDLLSTLVYGFGVAASAIVAGMAIMQASQRFEATAIRALVMNPTEVAWATLAVMVVTAYLFPAVCSPESDSV